MNATGTHKDRGPTHGRPPRVGFLGVGWIGRHRMQAMLEDGGVEAAAICDPSPDMVREALKLAPEATVVASFASLLNLALDGVVIATPSALHAQQSIQALQQGLAVFCQKPLGRSKCEVETVVAAARKADRLLCVDLSYRHTAGMRLIRDLVRSGEIGRVFAADLVFHNAYGPDKAWFFDRTLSGGGCVVDLGIHLVDLALWTLGHVQADAVDSKLLRQGRPISSTDGEVEDFATAVITLSTGTVVRLICSWHLQAGRDAIISASFYGTKGGAALHNVNGSFYDFVAEHYRGTQTTVLCSPPDQWAGRCAVDWARRLAANRAYDSQCEELIEVSALLDRIYRGTLEHRQ
ncbi:oxidoreductase [Rhizobium sp. R72]|uniref:Gfo/Idh/MocA family protein n=1 Tax=unclassified Rhizobium TaxID=2613769 RepID=UPI000B530843|nr:MULTISPECIES: Gfo/Idh/MocA family oxidoreductase [unclassified Rhizobium]OWV92809.1 oxidoreductase [Rhizobium sp. R72]OWV93020.1 oxidoreductase [Rhizobium sp. R711]